MRQNSLLKNIFLQIHQASSCDAQLVGMGAGGVWGGVGGRVGGGMVGGWFAKLRSRRGAREASYKNKALSWMRLRGW